MFELKKSTKELLDGTEDCLKTWRKTNLCFLKWPEEFGQKSGGVTLESKILERK